MKSTESSVYSGVRSLRAPFAPEASPYSPLSPEGSIIARPSPKSPSKDSPPKEKFLDLFYLYVDEEDWEEGLDLYQTGKISNVSEYDNLVYAKVETRHETFHEVRLKLLPSGTVIQWLECTCKKNRSKGQYCEHLAAFMIYLDSQKPSMFSTLNPGAPIKIPPVPRGRSKSFLERQEDKGQKATQAIIESLKDNILSISLTQNGTILRIKLAIKSGETTFYDLGIDDAAQFVAANPSLAASSRSHQSLKILQLEAFFGSRLKVDSGEKVQMERVLAIKINPLAGDAPKSKSSVVEQCYYYAEEGADPEQAWFEFFTIKPLQKYLGKNFVHLLRRGYLQLPDNVSSEWHEMPTKQIFKEDQAAELLATNGRAILVHGPIFVPTPIGGEHSIGEYDLGPIEVLEESNGWFFLDPRYQIENNSISLTDFIRHYRKKKRNYLKHGNKWLKVPDFIKQQHFELDDSGQYLKLDTLGLIRLKATLGNFDHIAGSKKALSQITRRLDFNAATEMPELKGTKLELRHYQHTGLQWLWWLYQNNLHGLLADEMGLGKTHQAMALMSLILQTKPESRFIVIAPTTVLDHWFDKVGDFCPNIKSFIYHGPQRSQQLGNIQPGNHQLMITSYGVLLRDIKVLAKIPWQAIILDEAHYIKNHSTETYKAACLLQGEIKLCLTGTPIENNLSELKNLFDFLVPGFLGSNDFFRKNFIQPIEKHQEGSAEETKLQKLIHPFKLRRVKANVLQDLPEKIEDIRHCHLSEDQVKLYKNILALKAKGIIQQLQDDETPIPYLHVFSVLNHLKQICDHPALFYDVADPKRGVSGKFELLKSILAEAIDSDHKVVIYSQYLQMIDIIHKYLGEQGVKHVVLTGRTKKRGEVIQQFQTDPDCKVFVGSLLAGGVGIDLTAASVVVHYDRWWNSSKENQATDRVHRIGQQKNVLVLKLITRGTLEEKIHEMIEEKRNLFEKFMDKDEEMFQTFSRQELLDLLQ